MRLKPFALVSTVCACLAAVPALAQQEFLTPVSESRTLRYIDYFFWFGAEDDLTAGLGLADFDGDQDTDIAVINGRHWPGRNAVLFNNGQGRFPQAGAMGAREATGYGGCPFDADGDGDMDMLVARDLLAPIIYLNDGKGNFPRAKTFGAPGSARDCAVGDFNGDGLPDAVITDRGEGSFVAWGPLLDDPQTEIVYEGFAVGVTAGDADGDGIDDLVFSLRGGGTLALLLSTGAGFDEPIVLGEDDSQSRAAAFGDMDGDGDNDIVAGLLTGANRLYWNDDGAFGRLTEIGRPDGVTAAVALADLDGDGRLDAVFGNDGANTLVMNRAGGFETVEIAGDEEDTYDIAAGDITGDGLPEVIVANSGALNTFYWNVARRD